MERWLRHLSAQCIRADREQSISGEHSTQSISDVCSVSRLQSSRAPRLRCAFVRRSTCGVEQLRPGCSSQRSRAPWSRCAQSGESFAASDSVNAPPRSFLVRGEVMGWLSRTALCEVRAVALRPVEGASGHQAPANSARERCARRAHASWRSPRRCRPDCASRRDP